MTIKLTDLAGFDAWIASRAGEFDIYNCFLKYHHSEYDGDIKRLEPISVQGDSRYSVAYEKSLRERWWVNGSDVLESSDIFIAQNPSVMFYTLDLLRKVFATSIDTTFWISDNAVTFNVLVNDPNVKCVVSFKAYVNYGGMENRLEFRLPHTDASYDKVLDINSTSVKDVEANIMQAIKHSITRSITKVEKDIVSANGRFNVLQDRLRRI